MDKLLLDLTKFDQMNVLEYLLKKNEQWTDISEIVVKNSTSEMRDRQIRRLINKQKNSFSSNSDTDRQILNFKMITNPDALPRESRAHFRGPTDCSEPQLEV